MLAIRHDLLILYKILLIQLDSTFEDITAIFNQPMITAYDSAQDMYNLVGNDAP
jgi:hypothetical protein